MVGRRILVVIYKKKRGYTKLLSTKRGSSMNGTLRFGIIGCGVIGATHAEAITSLPGAQLVAVADIVPLNAQKLADKYTVMAYTDPREMVARAELDLSLIHISEPTRLG